MTESANPYAGEEEQASPEKMALLSRLCDRLEQEEKAVETAEAELKKAQERVRKLREHDIPDLMRSVGLKKLSTESGLDVSLREAVRATWPKDAERRTEAMEWLEQNGHGGLVKRQFIITFGRDEEAWAKKFEDDLRKRKRELNLERKEAVHPSTLCAFIREQLAEGAKVPMRAFSAFVQTFAEVKRDD